MRHPSRTVALASFAVAAAFASSRAAVAQDGAKDVPNREAALEMRKQFLQDLDSLHAKYVALAGAFPADKYSWRPAPGVRSVGEAFMHAASELYTFAPAAYGAQRSSLIPRTREAYQQFEHNSSKDSVLKHLNDGFAYTKQAVGGLDPATLGGTKQLFGGNYTIIETSLAVVDDLHEHLGQLIAYARMNGVKPPWTK